MPPLTPFHVAFAVDDLQAARRFYAGVLGCPEGRSADGWIDFNLYGHQIVAHHVPRAAPPPPSAPVDGQDVPVPHFGVVLRPDDWRALAERLRRQNVAFVLEPQTRFKGQPGEQSTLFLNDPAGNALEFKAFENALDLFATSPD